jgi:hypothetical protein
MKIECRECGEWLVEKRSICEKCSIEDMTEEFKRGIKFACVLIGAAVRQNPDLAVTAVHKSIDALMEKNS